MANEVYIVIRKTDGREWVDKETISFSESGAKQKAYHNDNLIPAWAKDNIIVRIAKYSLTEIKE